jgi:2-polyprenyl-3-methyl-5-hydroxy-6-metoxy-1,4-benzoquinol methylase
MCPLCRCNDNLLKSSIEIELVAQKWDEVLNIDVSSILQGSESTQLFKCQSCCLQFFWPSAWPNSSYLYQQLEKFDWYYMSQKWEYDIALAAIREKDNLLEIGCGVGYFIEQAQAQSVMHVEGIELNEHAVKKAQKKGLPVRFLDLKKLADRSPRRYDFICSFQVLEHVENPEKFINWACDLLKTGGRLILSVPNADSFLKHQFNVMDMPPHHVTKWSERTLSRLPRFFPLRLVGLRTEPLAQYHVDSYLDAYLPDIVKNIYPLTRFYDRFFDLARRFIKRPEIRKLLKGQSLLAMYTRL